MEEDLRADDVIIENIDLDDGDELNALLAELGVSGVGNLDDHALEVEIDDETTARPKPSFGTLADEDAEPAEGTVFDPDRIEGEPDEPARLEQIEIEEERTPRKQRKQRPAEAAEPEAPPAPIIPEVGFTEKPERPPVPPQAAETQAPGAERPDASSLADRKPAAPQTPAAQPGPQQGEDEPTVPAPGPSEPAPSFPSLDERPAPPPAAPPATGERAPSQPAPEGPAGASEAPSFPGLDAEAEAPAPAPPLTPDGGDRPNLREMWQRTAAATPSAEDEADEPSGIGGLVASVKAWVGERKQLLAKAEDAEHEAEIRTPEATGVDVSPPKRSWMARLGFGDEDETHSAPERESGFAGMVRPLSGSEIKRLQAEIAAEEPVFVRVEQARTSARRRQTIAFYVGLVIVVAFFAAFGSNYLTEVLPEVEVPEQIASPPGDAISAETWRDGVGAGLFALGLLLPFLSLLVAVEAIRRLLSVADGLRIGDLLIGGLGLVAAMAVLLALAAANVLGAAAWLVGFAVLRAIYTAWEERRSRG